MTRDITLGPLNHLCASTIHQITAMSIGAPHTRHVQFIVVGLNRHQHTVIWDRDFILTSVELGSIKIGTIKATKAHAATPIGVLNFPRFHGPARNLLPTKKTRMKIGIVKATNAPRAVIEKRAPTGIAPPKIRRVMRIPMTVLSQTALTGLTMHPWPIENAAMMVKASAARAVFCGKTCSRYEAHGWPRSESITLSMSMTV
ncbi:MAG: hypothetical protein Q9163_001448 [Psora crenata]